MLDIGYCFSASLPPMLAAAAITAIDTMEKQSEMFLELNNVCRRMHAELCELRRFRIGGHKDAPVKHLYLKESTECLENDEKLLRDIAAEVSIPIIDFLLFFYYFFYSFIAISRDTDVFKEI